MEEVVRTGLARFEYRHLPRHRQSEFAANAVECAADQDAFWAAHDVYMAGGDRTIYGRAGAVRVAGELGLDTERFGRCVDERTHLPTINADHQIRARRRLPRHADPSGQRPAGPGDRRRGDRRSARRGAVRHEAADRVMSRLCRSFRFG